MADIYRYPFAYCSVHGCDVMLPIVNYKFTHRYSARILEIVRILVHARAGITIMVNRDLK